MIKANLWKLKTYGLLWHAKECQDQKCFAIFSLTGK